MIISSGDCLSFSAKNTSKPIAFGLVEFTFSIIFAKIDLFQGNCPNFSRLFSSISIMTTSEDPFFNGKVFWYRSKLKKEIALTKLGFKVFNPIKKNNRIKNIM